jgi:putative spermidine/putrescine transport system ATP-binding protein
VFVTHDQGEALSMSSRVAVFNHGRIEQVGTPRDIYERPTTAFVAGFVGTSNTLSAGLSQRLTGVGAVHTLRPERIRVVSAAAPVSGDDVVVDGTVTDVQYLGAESRLTVRLADGTVIVASIPSDGLGGVAMEGTISLAWPRHAASPVAADQQFISQGETPA